jgi:16S rRNA processing protein RimM
VTPASSTTRTEVNAGKLVGVFGLRGELKLDASRIGNDALVVGLAVHARLADGSERELRVGALRLHQGRPLVTFEGIGDATAAAALVGARLTVARETVRMRSDEFFDDDLVGCTLVDPDGTALGEVRAVEHHGVQDLLVVGPQRAMVPLVRAFIREVDLDAHRIVVSLPPGLLDPSEAEDENA